MVGFNDTPGRRIPVIMETSVVDISAAEPSRTPALDWKEFFGSSVSLGSTVLTAFDQLRDSQRHPERAADDVQDRQVPTQRRPVSDRPTSPSRPSDDDQSSTMPSLTMSSQSTTPTNFADDCQKCPPSPISSSSSSQLQHLGVPQSSSPTLTTTVAVACSTSDSPVDADCRLRRGSSDDCRTATPSPPVSLCAVSFSGGAIGRCVVQPAATASSNRTRVIAEIVDTERKYVRDLRQIVDGYMDYISRSPEVGLCPDDAESLFGNIKAIYHFNRNFLLMLETCGKDAVAIARCFVSQKDGFAIYSDYCTNYPKSVDILTGCMRDPIAAGALKRQQMALQHSLPLGSYLLKPVQRILKYHLLLQHILEREERSRDCDIIAAAVESMKAVAAGINEMKARHEQVVRTQEISSVLHDWHGPDLSTVGHVLLEDKLRMFGAKAERHVILFKRALLVAKKRDDVTMSVKAFIECSNLMLIESVPKEPLSFHVVPFDCPRLQYTFQTRNLDQKRLWCKQIKEIILDNYNAVIPDKAKELVMMLGNRVEDIQQIEHSSHESVGRRQHVAPQYLERRRARRKSTGFVAGLEVKGKNNKKEIGRSDPMFNTDGLVSPIMSPQPRRKSDVSDLLLGTFKLRSDKTLASYDLHQGGRGKEKRGDNGRVSLSSCQRKPSASSSVGVSLRAVTERYLSPISGRRSSRTLPRSDPRQRDATALSSHRQQSRTLPMVLRTATTNVGAERHSLAHQDSDDSAASCDSPLLECTHFGAEIRQISPPTRHHAVETDVTDTQPTGSYFTNDTAGSGCFVLSTEHSPSRHTEQDEEEEEKEKGNPWLRQPCSHLINRRNRTNRTTTKTAHRRHSHDCTPTSPNDVNEFPPSLPVNMTVAGGLQLLDDGGSHPLSIVGRQEHAAAAADNSASLCLAREILHELEEDLVESSQPPSFGNVPRSDCGDQQMAATESPLQRPSASSDDVPRESSGPLRRSNNWTSPTSHCDSGVCQTFGEVRPGSNTSPSITDVDVVSGLASAAANSRSPSQQTSNTEPDAQAETIVGTLKNMFVYFVAKLAGHDRNGVQSDPHGQQTPSSPCNGGKGTSKESSHTQAVCLRDRKWLVGKNGASLSAAAHLAEILTARQKDDDTIGERMALPRPLETLDRVLSLVPLRAAHDGQSLRRRRCKTTGDVDLIRKLHRRLGDNNSAEQSAVVRRTSRSISVLSIPDWIWSNTKYVTVTSSPSSSRLSSSLSVQSSFYERRMISDLEDVGGTAETDVGDSGRISLCASDFCDDADDDAPVFPGVLDATLTDVDKPESFSNLTSSMARNSEIFA